MSGSVSNMPVELPLGEGDDPNLVRCAERLLGRAILSVEPQRVYVARLDNWFGHRWYGFRGKHLGVAGFCNRMGDRQLEVLPPFVPERVLAETCYEQSPDGEYRPAEVPERLAIHQIGSENFSRHLDRFTDNGILFWYSGNSSSQTQASLMLYANTPEVKDGWYLSLRRENDAWQFQHGIGISKGEIS
jgi:hypothetical protein